MSDTASCEVDRKELERALEAIRDRWARGERNVAVYYDIAAVLYGRRSGIADRALDSAWFDLIDYLERPEFVETLSVLARATLEGYQARDRANGEQDRAYKEALAVFETPSTSAS